MNKLSALGATLLLALAAGVGSAHANVPPAPESPTQAQDSTQTQDATNTVAQTANSTAVSTTGQQTNVNGGGPAPFAPAITVIPHSNTGRPGDVDQSNSSGAESSATNVNHSNQTVGQDQGSTQAQTAGSDCGCKHGGSQPGSQTQNSKQDQSAENKVDQEANPTAVNVTRAQTNVNQPIRVLSPGRDDVDQSNRSGASSSASNWNWSDQSIDQDQRSTQTQEAQGGRYGCGCQPNGSQEQHSTQNQSAENKVDQDANSTAVNVTGQQTNVNGGGLAVDSIVGGGGSGDVDQSNRSGASSRASNWNWSDQAIDQGQSNTQSQTRGGGRCCGGGSSGDQS